MHKFFNSPKQFSLYSLIAFLTVILTVFTANAQTGACTGAGSAALEPAFRADYSCVSLGSITGVPTSYGGLTLKYDDPNTLLIGGQANQAAGRIYQVGVVRDANGHITGFTGSAAQYHRPERPSELATTAGSCSDQATYYSLPAIREIRSNSPNRAARRPTR
jgi:hypothetical protein